MAWHCAAATLASGGGEGVGACLANSAWVEGPRLNPQNMSEQRGDMKSICGALDGALATGRPSHGPPRGLQGAPERRGAGLRGWGGRALCIKTRLGKFVIRGD